jgi:hypothetical protein
MAELRNIEKGTVVWRGDDPREALAAILALGDKAAEHSLDGLDSTELPAIEPDSPQAEKLPKVKLIAEKAASGAEQLIVNAATGEIEQRIEGSGKVEIADPDDPDGKRTIEVTAAQLRDLSLKRSIEHMAESHERVLADHDRTADLTASALAEVMREAEQAGERIDPAEALSRAQEKLPDAEPAATEPPSEVRHDGEAVKLTIEKAGG